MNVFHFKPVFFFFFKKRVLKLERIFGKHHRTGKREVYISLINYSWLKEAISNKQIFLFVWPGRSIMSAWTLCLHMLRPFFFLNYHSKRKNVIKNKEKFPLIADIYLTLHSKHSFTSVENKITD